MSTVLPKRKRNVVTLEMKLGVLERLKEGLPMSVIAREFGIGKSTVHDIKKIEKDLVNWVGNEYNNGDERKQKMVKIKREKLDEAVHKWCVQETQEGRECTDSDTRRVAERFAECIGVTNFPSFSGSWLLRFKKRFKIGKQDRGDTHKIEKSDRETLNQSIFPLVGGIQVYMDETDAVYVEEPNHAKSTEHSPSETYFKPLNEDDRGAHSSEKLPKEEEGVFIKQDLFGSGVFIAEEILNEESINIVKEEQIDVDVAHGFSSSNDDSQCFSEKVESVNENDRTIFMETQESPTNTKNTKKSNVKTKSNVSTRNLPDVSNSSVDVSVKGKNQSGETDYGSLINSMIEEMDLTQQVLAKFYILKIIDMGKKQYLSPSGVVL